MHHKCANGRVSHLASGSNGSELFFPSLFVLFAFLEQSLRDLDVLHDQRMSFWSCSCGPVMFTVTPGTLDKTQERQHLGVGQEVVERTYVVDGAIKNTGLASNNERPCDGCGLPGTAGRVVQ